MTPPSRLAALPNPSLEPPLTAGHLLKPLDFTSTQTIFLFPPMSSKLKGSSTRDPGPVNDAFYVAPTASRFWSAFNHAGTRLFVNVLRKLSANVQVPATVATNAMNVGIRATRYLFAQLDNSDPPEDILALVGLVHQLCDLVPDAPSEYLRIPSLSAPDRLLPENFQVPFWAAPTELELANAPTFPQSPRKTPARLSSIAHQQDDDGEEEQDEGDGDGDVEMERSGKTPSPPPSPPKGKRTRPTTRSERKSTEYVEDSDNESVPASKVAKSSRSGNAASQSRQPRSAMNKDAAVILKKPKLLDKDEGIIRHTTLTDIKDRLGQAVVSILQTKETFHKRVNIDLPDEAAATITVAVARKGPGVKPPFRSALGSATHARIRETDDFESEFVPLELIPLTTVESLSLTDAKFPPFSCMNCILARVECQPFGYGVQCSRCQTKRIGWGTGTGPGLQMLTRTRTRRTRTLSGKTCEHTLSSIEMSNVFASLAKQNSFSLEMTNFVIDDLKTTIDRASRDYDTLRQSVSAVDRAVCRAIEHARAASEVLGTEGFLAYFEEAKSNEDPDAVDLLNRLAKGYNEMMTAPESIASTPARQATPAEEGELAPSPPKQLPATPAAKKLSSKAPRSESRVIRDASKGANDN
ncbi:hypothetical protein GGX14DRAFT_568684 [Mycena pura]|uniref:Uncharacterized protein n=1 Tax=Mycena pura TaxID=153505 RepID=A0AAD6YCK3_9AGAR|nr:hypothetical protein GGX14DRAFT_568684 [Mycena pura]